jgi:hypothetical protein
MRGKCRLRAFEKRGLRKIFVSKTDSITGAWRRQHNEELRELYSSSSVIRVINTNNEKVGSCGMYGEQDRCIQNFGGETRGKETISKTQV